jgi:hypothetical protein
MIGEREAAMIKGLKWNELTRILIVMRELKGIPVGISMI